MAQPERRIRPKPPAQPEALIEQDRASIQEIGLKVNSWQVHVGEDDEWHTVVYTVSRKRRKSHN